MSHSKKGKTKSHERVDGLIYPASEPSPKNPPLNLSFVKIITRDAKVISSYIENLAKWLEVYMLSSGTAGTTHLPRVPVLNYLTGLSTQCEGLNRSVLLVKERYLSKASFLEETIRELSYENKSLLQRFNSKDAGEDELGLYRAEFDSIKREIDQLREEILASCSDLAETLQQAEKLGLRSPKGKSEGLRGYVIDTKKLVFSLCKALRKRSKSAEELEILLDGPEANSDALVGTLLSIISALLSRIHSLKEKKTFFARNLRNFYKIVTEGKVLMRKLLKLEETERPKPARKLRVVLKTVHAVVRMKQLIGHKAQVIGLRGLKLALSPQQFNPALLQSISSLSSIVALLKSHERPEPQKPLLNLLM